LSPAAPGALENLTPYSAPEALRGGAVDARTDIFAFGAVLYEMAAGRRAFMADDPEALKEEILAKGVSPIGHEGLDQLVRQCLAKDPAERLQKMQKVQMQLKLVGIAEQQGETSVVSHFETAVSEELERQAAAIAELDRTVTARSIELAEAVSVALEGVQSQFNEVEKFLAASEQRADRFGQEAVAAVETTQREVAALREGLAGEVNALAQTSKGQAAAIKSIKASVAWNEDCVERVVDAIEGLQSVLYKQVPAPKVAAMAIAS
jgi:hypothetical protein